MADPVTMSAAAAFAGAAGSVLDGIQGYNAAKAEAKQADANAKIVGQQTAAEEARIRNQGARLRGEQIAAAGASGITLDGSPTDIILDSAVESEMEALNARYRGTVERIGYKNQARVSKWEASNALTRGIIGAISPALKGGAALKSPGSSGAATIPGGKGIGGIY